MAIEIKNYNGTTLTVIQDGTEDTTSASIPFVGKGYKGWGTPIQENLLWLLQNFAGTTEPTNPVAGQLWYDTGSGVLKSYTGTTWTTNQGIVLQSTAPTSGNNVGSMWFDTTNMQLFVWTGTSWVLVGPLASSSGTDPVEPSVPTVSSIDSIRLVDNLGSFHNVWRLVIGGTILATFSRDPSFIPRSSALLANGFPRIYPGITFNNTLAGIDVGIFGEDTIFKSPQNNLPGADNTYNLGSAALKFLDVFAYNGKLGNVVLGTSGTVISESSDGIIKMTDAAGTGFGLLQLGGTTNSYPAIKRSGTAVHFRRADDSAFADISAGTVNAVDLVVTNTLSAGSIGIASVSSDTVTLSSTGTGSKISQSSDGVILLTNDAATNFTRLQLGGTTAAFPSIKRNGAGIDFRVANDTAAANISAGVGTFTSTVVTGAMTVGSAGSKITNSADGILLLSNNAVNNFTRLQLGGTDANFPSIKRNGAAINFRLSDDTSDANITAANVTSSGAISSSSTSDGIGYSTGAGDSLTQTTSVTNTVISAGRMTGQITLFSGGVYATGITQFTFTNPSIAATDHVIVTQINGLAANMGAYNFTATPSAGSAIIRIRNLTAGTLTETASAIVLKYTIIKSVNA